MESPSKATKSTEKHHADDCATRRLWPEDNERAALEVVELFPDLESICICSVTAGRWKK